MDTLIIITTIGFALWEIRNIFLWISLWQTKEYRFDRLLVHLRETVQGKNLLYSPISALKWVTILSYSLVIFIDKLSPYYQYPVAIIYVYEGLVVIYEMLHVHQFKRPVRTIKAYTIFLLSVMFIGILFTLPMTDIFLWFLLLDRVTVLVVSLFVFFFSFPTEIYIDVIVQKAKRKMSLRKDLLVIAVSGSYGKSSTKEYIAQVLSEKFHVVKTSGSNNTPIGIAKTVLNAITPDTEIFVVEMGAYKLGEIAELCDIVAPRISVTTAVSDQHFSLYGSVKNAINTEVELISALPEDGIALFNGNNPFTEKLYKKTKKKKILYRVSQFEDSSSDVNAFSLDIHKNSVLFHVRMGKSQWKLSVPLIGGHMVENLLPALYIASFLGMKQTAIIKALRKLRSPDKTMVKTQLSPGIFGIDDTFNASPESVFAVLDYMKLYKAKKFLVLTPLIELGNRANKRHRILGENIGLICDYLYLTNANHASDIIEGLEEKKSSCEVTIDSHPDNMAREIFQKLKRDDIIVFEGKEAAFVQKSLQKLYTLSQK